jgi:hypothetical protein
LSKPVPGFTSVPFTINFLFLTSTDVLLEITTLSLNGNLGSI